MQSPTHSSAAKGIPPGNSQGSTALVQFCIELEFGSDQAVVNTWEGWIIA